MDFQSLVELAPWTTIAQICNLLLQIFLRFQQVQRCLCHMRGGTRIDLFGQIRQHMVADSVPRVGILCIRAVLTPGTLPAFQFLPDLFSSDAEKRTDHIPPHGA